MMGLRSPQAPLFQHSWTLLAPAKEAARAVQGSVSPLPLSRATPPQSAEAMLDWEVNSYPADLHIKTSLRLSFHIRIIMVVSGVPLLKLS